jgi:hypothetical protein
LFAIKNFKQEYYNMPAESKLQPCPFCGTPAKLSKYWWFWSKKIFDVECPLCSCQVGDYLELEPDAINRWNQRASIKEENFLQTNNSTK